MQQIRWFDLGLALVGMVLAFSVPTLRAFLREVVMHPLTPSSTDQGNAPNLMQGLRRAIALDGNIRDAQGPKSERAAGGKTRKAQ
jgi:hypothetical protein